MLISLVEDDYLLAPNIVDFFSIKGIEVKWFETSSALIEHGLSKFDLLIFDVNLPDYSGLEMLEYLNRMQIKAPTVIITARDDLETLRSAFNHGCVDFLKKPLNLEELYIRVRNRITKQSSSNIIELSSSIQFDRARNKLISSGVLLVLTKTQSSILGLLVDIYPDTVSYEDMGKHLYGDEVFLQSTVVSHIRDLRKLVGKDVILNASGLGYRLNPEKK